MVLLLLVCRPEALYLADRGIPGRILRATYLGSWAEYEVALADEQSVIIIESNPSPSLMRRNGDEVFVNFHADSLHLLPA